MLYEKRHKIVNTVIQIIKILCPKRGKKKKKIMHRGKKMNGNKPKQNVSTSFISDGRQVTFLLLFFAINITFRRKKKMTV